LLISWLCSSFITSVSIPLKRLLSASANSRSSVKAYVGGENYHGGRSLDLSLIGHLPAKIPHNGAEYPALSCVALAPPVGSSFWVKFARKPSHFRRQYLCLVRITLRLRFPSVQNNLISRNCLPRCPGRSNRGTIFAISIFIIRR
jgi:hypothetical protein